ncbi:unnamed protein product [Lactuca virosa]|uniref:Uncharacterized protein n=1 Tax=Lactuca virosa TaxID=75947 RepID=A0AAU9LYT0_9ASTR|nr:unnamed protein product [Lactuca virosa]
MVQSNRLRIGSATCVNITAASNICTPILMRAKYATTRYNTSISAKATTESTCPSSPTLLIAGKSSTKQVRLPHLYEIRHMLNIVSTC